MHKLTVLSGGKRGTTIDVHNQVIIGRDQACDLMIEGNRISRRHATLKIENDHVLILDHSANGTYVNGEKVQLRRLVKGDRIQCGDCVIVYTELQENLTTDTSKDQTWKQHKNKSLIFKLKFFIDHKIIPAILGFTYTYDFKYVVSFIFIACLTVGIFLGVYPVIEESRTQMIEQVAFKGQAIARHIRSVNETFFMDQAFSRMSLKVTELYPEVLEAYIVNDKGTIMVPSSQVNQFLDYPFLSTARERFLTNGEAMTFSYQTLDDSKLGLVLPFMSRSFQTGNLTIGGYVVLVMNYRSVDLQSTEIIALILRAGIFAAIFGLIFLYIIFQMYDQPLKSMMEWAERKLRNDPQDSEQVTVNMPINLESFKKLLENYEGLINKAAQSDRKTLPGSEGFKRLDLSEDKILDKIKNFVSYCNLPILVLDQDLRIKMLNIPMEELTGMRETSVVEGNIKTVARDHGFSSLIEDLVQQVEKGQLEPKQDYPYSAGLLPTYLIKVEGHYIVFVNNGGEV